MKHLRLFKTSVDYESATLDLPNLSYVEETGTFVKSASVDIPTGTSGIPEGWTVETV